MKKPIPFRSSVVFKNCLRFAFAVLLCGPFSMHFVKAQEQAPKVQDNATPKNAKQKKADQKKEARKAEGESLIQKGLERHMEIQTKPVRKRMKQSKAESERINKNKRKPFYKSWFRKSQKSRKWYQFWKKRGKK